MAQKKTAYVSGLNIRYHHWSIAGIAFGFNSIQPKIGCIFSLRTRSIDLCSPLLNSGVLLDRHTSVSTTGQSQQDLAEVPTLARTFVHGLEPQTAPKILESS